MNRKFTLVTVMLLVIFVSSMALCGICGEKNVWKEKVVATSFYPTYLIAENMLSGVEDVEVYNIAKNVQGCVHNFQLSTENMKQLEKADMLVINGLGMESYIEKVASKVDGIKIVDSSKGAKVLKGNAHNHNHEHDHDSDSDDKLTVNSHIWMSLDNYKKQVENVANEILSLENIDREKVLENKKMYLDKLDNLERERNEIREIISEKNIHTITFHDSLKYLLHDFNIESVMSIDVENEAGIPASKAREAIYEIKAHDIKYIIADTTLSPKIPEVLSSETGVKVIYLDNLLSGKDGDLDNYITKMHNNYLKLKELGE